jgi:hypothetical protein
MTSNTILKRLESLEAQMATRRSPTLINVWTPSLAARIEKVLPPFANVQLVHLPFHDSDAEEAFEASLRRDNPKEAGKLDALLRGEV